MQVIELTYPHTLNREEIDPTIMAVGFFDGVHLGHQKLIKTAVELAEQSGKQSAVMTFDPHPSVVLKKEQQHVKYITPLADKIYFLERMGVDRLYVVRFTESLAELLPQQFVDHFFIGLNVDHVVAGFDFSYGRMGKGNMESLPFHSREQFTQTTIPKVERNGEKVSSTRVREAIKNGELPEVTDLLGRPLSVQGEVIKGDQRGRTIGFPTANIHISDAYLLPKVGVYAVAINVRGKWYHGMANLGYKPTFYDEAEKPSLEVYIFDFNGDIYGEDVKVEWHAFIREEKKFNGIDALIAQLHSDEEEIRRFFQ
ncbi:bifunctional riboflavin kinase/FAD synthetase [Thalassobacillus hwangdonensis]|uniref:Riboflavin biosynthesis protein n=1 Tax=Thalassobacillus hwangdonensis TaxID=546108 RepID=A0ABW3KX10_9BACI